MLPIICLHLWAARNQLQNRTNDKLKQFQTFFFSKKFFVPLSIPKSETLTKYKKVNCFCGKIQTVND